MPLELCWDSAYLHKAGIFLWAASQKRILTVDRFRKMGFEGPSRCSLCKESEETAEHLLYQCPYAKECRYWLRKNLLWTSPLPEDLISHLKSWPKGNNYRVYSKL